MLHLIGLTAVVLVGAATQRITGLGFSLVTSPLTVMLLGPFDGVLLVNTCGMVTALFILAQVWRDIDVRKAGLLLGPAVAAVLPGAWVARHLATPLLAVLVGGLVLAALVTVVASEKARVLRGGHGAVVAGIGSGFMSVTAGISGPAITVYAVSTGWPHRRFAATAQLIFAVLSATSLAAKGGLPPLAANVWVVAAAGMAIGVVMGNRLADRIAPARARYAVMAIAITGAVLTVCRGVLEL